MPQSCHDALLSLPRTAPHFAPALFIRPCGQDTVRRLWIAGHRGLIYITGLRPSESFQPQRVSRLGSLSFISPSSKIQESLTMTMLWSKLRDGNPITRHMLNFEIPL